MAEIEQQAGPEPQGIPIQFAPGQQPTPEQIQQIQQQIAAEAEKAGLTVPEYVERMKAQLIAQAQQRQQQQLQQQQQQAQHAASGAQPGQQEIIQQGQPPTPESLALAAFLRSQDLKPRTCILQEKRHQMFKVKRAIRALHSDAYKKAQAKNPLLPEVNDRVTAENCFKLLPRSFLALRVSKIDEAEGHEGHDHGKKKHVKGLWTVKIEPQQEAADEFYYAWFYEGPQWKNRLAAVGALVGILAVVFFPVWPYHLRLGVWYVSMGMLGLLGLFFAMAIFRLILFVITMFVTPPGLWLYPNLFEDVGFFDSFKPLWAWHEDELAIKKRKKEERQRKKARREAKGNEKAERKGGAAQQPGTVEEIEEEAEEVGEEVEAGEEAHTSATDTGDAGAVQHRNLKATVEEED
ncbi:translocation protein [Dissoconium aciculare CBS 342.82]|uniref:Translocation protein SEC62 n=1 Tax=Dissoconium aciculare CBS 342.82 TaxID=1314786 RepID=A0A6J3M7V0_9PEZI|nr:translocation protein [Dissoconium aciculare CBS 342.82]KAF1823649.1 translocation protein [Dissoconium aciculare CBS 342.82]